MAVFVLDRKKEPLMPCSEKRARLLLNRGRARVHKMYPFSIRLVDRTRRNSAAATQNRSRLKADRNRDRARSRFHRKRGRADRAQAPR
jgi:hypothetical protein